MAMTKEVITLQIGNYANFVGTHWWNIQESSFRYKEDSTSNNELNHDVLFREGRNLRDVTFTPRLIFCDFNESLGSMPAEGNLYGTSHLFDNEEESIPWDRDVEVHRSASIQRNDFLCDMYEEDKCYENGVSNHQIKNKLNNSNSSVSNSVRTDKSYNLDQDVKTWTDFKKVHYHPRSTLLLNHNPETFGSWISGLKLTKSGDKLNLLEETVRFYAEECDNMQGFHVICDLNNGFGGFACSAMEYLHDEFLGKCCAVFPVQQAVTKPTASKIKDNNLSTLLTLAGLLENSTFVCPLSLCEDAFTTSRSRHFPQLIYDASSKYHTSAIIATCLEGTTQPYRLKTPSSSLLHLTQTLTSGSRRLLALSAAMPLPFEQAKHQCLADLLCDYYDTDPWLPLTPNVGGKTKSQEHCFSQAVTLVGLSESLAVASSNHIEYDKTLIHKCRDPNAVIKMYLEGRFPRSNNIVSTFQDPIKVSTPFPHIFSKNLQYNGFTKCKKNLSGEFSGLNLSTFVQECSGISTSSDAHKRTLELCGRSGQPSGNVESIPVLTNLKSSTQLVSLLNRCSSQAAALKRWVSQSRHGDSCQEHEALVEAEEQFRTLQHDYTFLTDLGNSDNSDE